MKKVVLAVVLAAIVAFMSACQSQVTPVVQPTQVAAYYPREYTDFEGVVTEIKEEPKRIVSLSPAVTEIVTALAGTDVLIGRTEYCDYPQEVTEIQSIGDMYTPNIELIVSLEPDLVVVSAHTNPEVLTNLRTNGITAIRLFANDDFAGCYQMITDMGVILNRADKSDEIITAMKEKVRDIETRAKGLDKPTVYYLVSAGEFGDYAATGDTFINEMIEMAGGENIAKDGANWAYSLELLLEKDPDVIVTAEIAGYTDLLPEMEGYKDLTAVKTGRVHELDNNLVDRMGPRLADGLELLFNAIHSAN